MSLFTQTQRSILIVILTLEKSGVKDLFISGTQNLGLFFIFSSKMQRLESKTGKEQSEQTPLALH